MRLKLPATTQETGQLSFTENSENACAGLTLLPCRSYHVGMQLSLREVVVGSRTESKSGRSQDFSDPLAPDLIMEFAGLCEWQALWKEGTPFSENHEIGQARPQRTPPYGQQYPECNDGSFGWAGKVKR